MAGAFRRLVRWQVGSVCLAVGFVASLAIAGQVADISQTTQTTTIRVDSPIAPPPLQQEVITPEPSQAAVWIPGYWNRTPDNWDWVGGHWEQPPFENARYVAGYWQYDQSKYEWQPGHWAAATQGVVVAKPISPPPAFYEPIPQPTQVVANQTWVAGHWDWNGITWVWNPGFYAVPPAPQVVWTPGYWKRGLLGAYRWTPGHWATLP